MPKGQFHQLLAVLPSLKSAMDRAKNQTAKILKSEHLFDGFTKTFKAHKEEEAYLNRELTEAKPLAATVGAVLSEFTKHAVPFMDGEFQRDMSNLEAKADLSFGGKTITGVPATFLLQLRQMLKDIRSVFDAIPTLDPKTDWKEEPDKGRGVWASAPDFQTRTKKVKKYEIVVQPTEHHPAQTDAFTVDEPQGQFEIKHWSGLITPEAKRLLIKRTDELIAEVERARAQANQVEHSKEKIAEEIFSFLNGDLVE